MSRTKAQLITQLLSEMDYEQFYRYLHSRPEAEIRECLRRVTDVARKHSIGVDSEDNKSLDIDNSANQLRLQISQRVWSQYAVCSMFGTGRAELLSSQQLGSVTVNLLTTKRVAEFVVGVNEKIDKELAEAPQSMALSTTQVSKSSNSCAPRPTIKPTLPNSLQMDKDRRTSIPKLVQSESSSSESDAESACADTSLSPSPRKNFKTCKKRKIATWTACMDKALLEAVTSYKDDGWAAVAQHARIDATAQQCMDRWVSYLEPLQQGLRADSNWTESEISALENIVPKCTVQAGWSKRRKSVTKQHIEWKSVGKALSRFPLRCKDKWKRLHK